MRVPQHDVGVLAVIQRADALIDPQLLAGFSVTMAIAWSSFMSPQRTDFAASVFNRRACSALSELIETFTPLAVNTDACMGCAGAPVCQIYCPVDECMLLVEQRTRSRTGASGWTR